MGKKVNGGRGSTSLKKKGPAPTLLVAAWHPRIAPILRVLVPTPALLPGSSQLSLSLSLYLSHTHTHTHSHTHTYSLLGLTFGIAPRPSSPWSLFFVVAEDAIDTHCSSVGWRKSPSTYPRSCFDHIAHVACLSTQRGPAGPPRATRDNDTTYLGMSACLSSRPQPDNRTSRAAAGDHPGRARVAPPWPPAPRCP